MSRRWTYSHTMTVASTMNRLGFLYGSALSHLTGPLISDTLFQLKERYVLVLCDGRAFLWPCPGSFSRNLTPPSKPPPDPTNSMNTQPPAHPPVAKPPDARNTGSVVSQLKAISRFTAFLGNCLLIVYYEPNKMRGPRGRGVLENCSVPGSWSLKLWMRKQTLSREMQEALIY